MQIKATGNTFVQKIASQKGGEHLMQLAGWRGEVRGTKDPMQDFVG